MNPAKRHAIAAGTVFDGWTRHSDAAVVIEGSLVVGVTPQSELPPYIEIRKFPSEVWLVPGFIDLQVNGGGDVLFNNSPTPEAIIAIATAHRKYGTTALLPTFITDTIEKMSAAFAAANSSVGVAPGVLGIHLEGPFLSPERAGVHDAKLMRPPGPDDLRLLCGQRKGELLVTLAPEQVPKSFVSQLANSGIRVSLGHSMATYEQTREAMAEGLNGFTHLFNAMRPLASREPGPIAAALESRSAYFGMIVDGFHVAPAMLRLALRGLARPILVTDAMAPVGGRKTCFDLYGAKIQVTGWRCARPDGTLAGSVLDMATAVRNCVKQLGVTLENALQFSSRNPAEFIGLGHYLGGLRPGYRADIVALNSSSFDVLETWVSGTAD